MGHETSIHSSEWPTYDEALLIEATKTIVVQINGKLRAELQVANDADEAAIVMLAQSDPNVTTHLQDQVIRKTVYVADKLVNFVV